MTELVVVWNGSHGNADRDLLCVPPVTVPEPAERMIVPSARRDFARDRALVLRMLAERECWRITELSQKSGMPKRELHGFIQKWKWKRVIRSVCYGVIALNRGSGKDSAA